MILEMHDDEPPTLCGVARNIDYEYQAEQHVIDACAARPTLVLWLLFADDGGALRAWRRVGSGVEECPVPAGTKADPRSMAPRGAEGATDG